MAANSLTAVIPQLLGSGLSALRENAKMPMMVNRGYEVLAGEKGSTIDVPIPSAIAVQDVTPGATPPATEGVTPTSVPVALTRWKEAPFYMTDKDMLEAMNGTLPMQASEAIKALANEVDTYLLGLMDYFYGYQGTAGTTPFLGGGTPDTTDASGVRTVLNKQLCPVDGDARFLVLDPDAEGAALNVRAFQDASFGVGGEAILEGKIMRRLGFGWVMDQNVQTHTAGTITTGAPAKASTAQAIGLKAVVLTTAATTGAVALLEGDVISFAGHSQTYVVTANATQASASTDVTVNVEPGLQLALAGGEATSVKATHVMNGGFHRDAIAFATRPLTQSTEGLGAITSSVIDPISGLSLRLEVTREHKRTRFSYDILYGAAVIRRELGARLAG